LPALVTVVILRSWLFRRFVQITVTRKGLVLNMRGERTTVPLEEVQGVVLFKYEKGEAYGIDIARTSGAPVEVRAWDPTESEAISLRDRLRFLIADAGGDPYRDTN
jgi:hypothetical protein